MSMPISRIGYSFSVHLIRTWHVELEHVLLTSLIRAGHVTHHETLRMRTTTFTWTVTWWRSGALVVTYSIAHSQFYFRMPLLVFRFTYSVSILEHDYRWEFTVSSQFHMPLCQRGTDIWHGKRVVKLNKVVMEYYPLLTDSALLLIIFSIDR